MPPRELRLDVGAGRHLGSSWYAAEDTDDRPVLIGIPGGGYSAVTFDPLGTGESSRPDEMFDSTIRPKR